MRAVVDFSLPITKSRNTPSPGNTTTWGEI